MISSFNSLQTGKWILTIDEDAGEACLDATFQFPSNGKVDPNEHTDNRCVATCVLFQFPSNGKVDPNWTCFFIILSVELFQFPSNGKVDPNVMLVPWQQLPHICFNSLQTGKWILTGSRDIFVRRFSVSIPFKRESGS